MADMQPPISPFPTLTPWQTNNFPRGVGAVARQGFIAGVVDNGSQMQALPASAGASMGVQVPPNATPIYTPESACWFNGSKVFPVGLTSTKIVDAPPGNSIRNALVIRNLSTTATDVIYVEFGTDATTKSTFDLAGGEKLLFDIRTPQDDIYVIGSVANQISISWSVIGIPG